MTDARPYALLDFVKGEVRWLTPEEHQQMMAEWAKRTTVKDGVLYVDCGPPKP